MPHVALVHWVKTTARSNIISLVALKTLTYFFTASDRIR